MAEGGDPQIRRHALEARAARIAIRENPTLTYKAQHMTDSMTLIQAYERGSSSIFEINRAGQAMYGAKVIPRHVQSENNLADEPSRR